MFLTSVISLKNYHPWFQKKTTFNFRRFLSNNFMLEELIIKASAEQFLPVIKYSELLNDSQHLYLNT